MDIRAMLEGIIKANNNKLIDNPLSKAHLTSDYVIVWWYDRDNGLLDAKQGRDIRHRDLGCFPNASDFKAPVRGRVFKESDKFYNCVYDDMTYYQLSDLTAKLQSAYGIYISNTINSAGFEINRI